MSGYDYGSGGLMGGLMGGAGNARDRLTAAIMGQQQAGGGAMQDSYQPPLGSPNVAPPPTAQAGAQALPLPALSPMRAAGVSLGQMPQPSMPLPGVPGRTGYYG